ncbi:hypothetical protein HMPREF9123_2712 [Neisseria bacilliformis ATCC BAA-1200]|uniref:Uncharacterized protein n=1 Tax=Neisseria bacilliformis ATCC BAA-1200 TaxID=888742 RepID=F2BG55_9NEIS|nr:hypothetical protein HMPREF9123_2712 [Neisseria bacilliformis ATCC BAA-1200]
MLFVAPFLCKRPSENAASMKLKPFLTAPKLRFSDGLFLCDRSRYIFHLKPNKTLRGSP